MGSLAPGFRFHPTDEELVSYYLKRLICGKPFHVDAISVIDIYKYAPSDLPGLSRLKSRDLEWYFFSPLDKKYGSGSRTNRATDQGYWKTTGRDRPVRRGDRTVGMKKTLVFHIGRPSRGERTNWVMHEYRIVDEELGQEGFALDAFVLCRVFKKSGSGPKNGEQYGAPYVEEEWDVNVLVPEGGVNGDAHYKVGVEEELQKLNDDEQNLGLADPFVHGLPVSSDGQQPIIGLVENDGFPELLDEQQFFQMDQPPIPIEYFELDDLLNPLDADSNTVDPVDGELACYDALSHDPSSVNGSFLEINDLNPVDAEPSGFEMLDHNLVDGELAYYDALSHDPSVVNGSFLEIDDLNPFNAEPPGFEMVDQYLEYFDATDNYLNYMANDSSIVLKDEDPILNQSALTEERTRGNEQAYLEPPEPSKTHGDKGASSSMQKTQTPKVAPDVQHSEGWGTTLAKQASVILGSISAPPAFAAEFPTKESTFGQNSTTHSSSSIHVTSGMIHISGVTLNGDGKSWFFEKSEDADFLLPYDMKRDDVMTVEHLMSNSTEPMSNISLSKAGTVMVRSGFYCIFLWVLILSVSYKIGSYIYSG